MNNKNSSKLMSKDWINTAEAAGAMTADEAAGRRAKIDENKMNFVKLADVVQGGLDDIIVVIKLDKTTNIDMNKVFGEDEVNANSDMLEEIANYIEESGEWVIRYAPGK